MGCYLGTDQKWMVSKARGKPVLKIKLIQPSNCGGYRYVEHLLISFECFPNVHIADASY